MLTDLTSETLRQWRESEGWDAPRMVHELVMRLAVVRSGAASPGPEGIGVLEAAALAKPKITMTPAEIRPGMLQLPVDGDDPIGDLEDLADWLGQESRLRGLIKEGDSAPGRRRAWRGDRHPRARLATRPGQRHPILGAQSAQQLADNLTCLVVNLPPDALAWLDQARHITRGFPHDFLASADFMRGGMSGQLDLPPGRSAHG